MEYYHVSSAPLDPHDADVTPGPTAAYGKTVFPQRLTARFGKPVGLWYAHGLAWIDRVPKPNERPLTYTHKYKFPLTEEMFTEDITNPDKTKIFRLTASNIAAFEETFKPHFEEKLRNTSLKRCTMMAQQGPFQDLRTEEEKQARLQGVAAQRPIMARVADAMAGRPTDPRVCIAIRLVSYGFFFDEKMRPVWGGIDFDKSLFTPELTETYPFIEHVEIPSGCLWHPNKVMKDYKPVDLLATKGGKRTRRKRKLTRRRRTRK
jgi:hypothetical protein